MHILQFLQKWCIKYRNFQQKKELFKYFQKTCTIVSSIFNIYDKSNNKM